MIEDKKFICPKDEHCYCLRWYLEMGMHKVCCNCHHAIKIEDEKKP